MPQNLCTQRAYGYTVKDGYLVKLGSRLKLGDATSPNNRHNLLVRDVVYLMDEGDVAGHARYVGVRVNGELRGCIAIASTDPLDPLPLPSREQIESLKKIFGRKNEPQWFPYN